MADYPTKYLFIAQTQGITQAAKELNALQAAMQKVNAGSAPINLSRAQQAQSNAAAAAARANTALANSQNAASRAQTAGIRVTQQQTAANTQAAVSIQRIAAEQAKATRAQAQAQLAQLKLTNAQTPAADPNYLERFFGRFRSAFAYTVAFAAIGGTFAAIGGTVRAWVDAQIQLNDVVANTAILLGRSAEAGQQFANVQRSLSFATGQGLEEIAPSSMMAERVGQPGLAVSAAQWSMILPEIPASSSVDDLRALSIQFENLSLDEINDSLLAVMQNSGIAAGQLFDLSSSFGVFAGQLGLGETAGDLREIGGLFAALSNITGQTTPTLQNFVRRMADEFYAPDAALRQQLEAAGIQTVTQGAVTTTYDMFGNATRTAEEIRRPFTEIFAEIAQKGPAAIKAFSTAIDNSLGQPTQSQFILVAENWPRVAKTLYDVTRSTADFGEAAQDASEKLQVSLDRVGVAFTNFLSVIGDDGMLQGLLDSLGSALQNTYDALRDPAEGMRQISRGRQENTLTRPYNTFLGIGITEFNQANRELAGQGMERLLDNAYGDPALSSNRLHEILRVMQVPEELPTERLRMYAQSAIEQFAASDYVRERDNAGVGAQQFQHFTDPSMGEFSRVQALRAAYPGISDADLLARFDNTLTKTEKRALQPWRAMDGGSLSSQGPGGNIWPFSTGTLPSPWMSQGAPGLRNMMIQDPRLIQSLGSPFDMKQISLPKDMTAGDFDKAYDEVSAILTEKFGPAISEAEVELMAFSDNTSGLITAIGAYNADIAQGTVKWWQATNENEAAADVLASGFYDLAGAAGAATEGLGAILSRARITLPEGMTPDQWEAEYNKTEDMLSGIFGAGANLSEEKPKPYIFMDPSTGMPLADGGDLDPLIAGLTTDRLLADKAASDKALAEQKGYQSKALSSQEAYQNKMLGSWNGMINDLLKPSAVTGTDLFYNSKTGSYNDNWDEPVRRMKADINNALAGKPLEYSYGGLTPYMNMDAINAAMGMDQASKEGILRSEEAGVSERFYNMELPWEAYSGNTDSIIANAQAWIAGKQQKNANMANVQQLLIDAGLGPDAEAFVKAMEEPPILRSLFGGKSADEINTTVTEAVTPDMGKALTEQVANTPWSLTISGAIQKDVTNNYEVIVSAGMAIGKGLAEGSASMFAAAIIPLVLAAIVGRE